MDMMQTAFNLAKKASLLGEVPVGAVVVNPKTNTIIAQAHNLVEAQQNPLAHAEMLAIEQALAHTAGKYLQDYDLYVTLEPCALCASAISATRIRRLYFGAYDPKTGGVCHGAHVFKSPSCHFKPEVYGGMMEQQCSQLLTEFFQERR
jgi:tRNA(adenine34) deaminase